jgi:hypothetical protein
MTGLMTAVRAIDGAVFGGGLRNARYLHVFDGSAHAVARRLWVAAVMAMFPRPRDPRLAGAHAADRLRIAHASNEHVEDVVVMRDSVRASDIAGWGVAVGGARGPVSQS